LFEFINYGAEKLQVFLLVLLRASGLFVISPIFGHRAVPALAKIGLVILFALLMTMTLSEVTLEQANSLWQLAGMAFKEVLIGVTIGFVFTLLFMAVYAAGSMVGYQVGFIMAMVLDPTTQSQQSVMSQLWFVVATLIFLAINGHHLIISAFVDSYRVMPPGQVFMVGGAAELLMKYTAYVFVLALKLAGPIMVTVFLTDVALGVVAKMMPTMNVFIVGFPLKIAAGLFVMALSLPVFSYALRQATTYLDRQLGFLLMTMGKA
jgi:flagellar biosynthetic protein FliR